MRFIPSITEFKLDLRINTLYKLDYVPERFWLTDYNLVYDTVKQRFTTIGIIRSCLYPYVSLSLGTSKSKNITMHKILALARINNGPYEVIEHLDDDPFNLTIQNLKFSTQRQNSLRAFVNGRRFISEAIFEAILPGNKIVQGTMREISKQTGIPRMTLYDRFYKGPFDPTKKYAQPKLITVLCVTKIKEGEPMRRLGIRSIDHRNTRLSNKILHFDRVDVDLNA